MRIFTTKQMKEYVGNVVNDMDNITDLIYEQPWVDANDTRKSRSTGKSYSMLNQFLIWANGGSVGEYATFDAIRKEGGKVKKGAKAKPLFFTEIRTAKEIDKETGEEEVRTYPVWKKYDVFCIGEDTEGLEPKYKPEPFPNVAESVPELETVLKAYYLKYGVECHKSKACNEAFYNPTKHAITTPMMKQFKSKAYYYSVKCHETIHSTGHKTVLNRFKAGTTFGSENYGREELVAEIGAATLLRMFGIETDRSLRNNKAYIESWKKAIKNDPMMVVTAINNASKAVKVITDCR